LSNYEALNAAGLKTLIASGTQLRPYSAEILKQAKTETEALFADLAQRDANFKAIYEPWKTFQQSVIAWNNTNEWVFAEAVKP